MKGEGQIQNIKNKDGLYIQGIDYGKVVSVESYDTSLRGYIKNLIKCLCFDFEIQIPTMVDDKIFIYSMSFSGRKDYDEIKKYFTSFFPEFCVVDVKRKKSLRGLLKKMAEIAGKTVHYAKHGMPSPLLIAILVTEYEVLHELYLRVIPWDQIKLLGTFFDASCADNLATQLGKMHGAKTFTLQHGQYRILRKGFENADAESYKNFSSDMLLAWGEATRDEFVKYGIDGNRIVPVGALRKFSFNQRLVNIVSTNVFGVILSGESYRKSNIGLLEIANEVAKKTDMKYFVRFHPKNRKYMYMKHIKSKWLADYSFDINNEEYVVKVQFSIIHMTGVFVEMLSLNSPIFIYEDKYLEDVFKIHPFCFKNEEELAILLRNNLADMKMMKEEQYSKYRYFNHSGNIKDNYQRALNSLETMK